MMAATGSFVCHEIANIIVYNLLLELSLSFDPEACLVQFLI